MSRGSRFSDALDLPTTSPYSHLVPTRLTASRTRGVLVTAGVAMLIALCGGCRRAKPPVQPLDILPSARLTPAELPAGGPVSVEYAWRLGAAVPELSGAYGAFVHFVDREGSLLFTDDHVPSPPVEAWKPGQTYAYRRTILTREFPYAGEVHVLMGLYSATGTGERLPLRGDDEGRRAYRVARLTLLPRDRDLALAWEGLYAPEGIANAPLLVMRFMKRTATCRFPNPSEEVAFFLSGDLVPDAFPQPPVLTIEGRAGWRASLPLAHTMEAQLLRVRIPVAALGRRSYATLRLTMNGSYVPRALDGSDDPRELSLRIRAAHVLRVSALAPVLLEGAIVMTP